MLRYLLDTDTVIYVIKKRPIEVLKRFNEQASRMAISSITLSELIYGAHKSERVSQNLEAVEEFVSHLVVLPYEERAAVHCGEIRAQLEKKGKSIGMYDTQIAAHARSQGLTLVTNNKREFARVPGLTFESWV